MACVYPQRCNSMPAPKISLIIVSFNGCAKLRACLAAVCATVDQPCEIIVLDNASAESCAAMVAHEFPTVTLLRSPTNVGFGAGNNLAVHASHGEYLVFLNPDTVAQAGWLTALLAPFKFNPQIGLVTAKIVLADQPERINTCGNVVHLTGLALCRGLGAPQRTFARAEEVDAISGAAFAMRRSLFMALGGFDADFFLYMEDTDLSWRARLAGWQVWYTPHSVVQHHYTLRISPRKVFYQERNRYLMLCKCLRWSTLWLLLPALLLAEVVTWGFVLTRERAQLRNKLQAYAACLTTWPTLMHKRQRTQALRQVSDRTLLRHTQFTLDFGQTAPPWLAALAQCVFAPSFALLKAVTLLLVW